MPTSSVSGWARWIGRVLSAIAILFLAVDGGAKLLEIPPVLEGTARLGYPTSVVFGLGAILVACTLAYAVPGTAALGAILLTGYLGGAVATHVRLGRPLLTHSLFPVYVAAFVWGGLLLRDARLRAFLPGSRA